MTAIPHTAVPAPDPEAPPDPADVELVARARRGEMAAFEELVRRHRTRIFGLVYHMTGHREDAEDLVQAAFVRAYRALGRFRGQSAFYTWLYRIASNLTLNFLKRRSRRGSEISLNDIDAAVERDPDYVDLVSQDSPVRQASLTDLQHRIHEGLGRLSDKHREVVVLHDIQGLPHEEIARIQGVPPSTVRTRLFYARKLLQGELKEFME
jgi:RNA polymerase sigma-70 factor (ECF subfamily)